MFMHRIQKQRNTIISIVYNGIIFQNMLLLADTKNAILHYVTTDHFNEGTLNLESMNSLSILALIDLVATLN